ncbi:tetratricopeptide repeat protein [Panacibacter ginsenosidivorans]|uniref:Tetratricopeptide repeat protein n=1 Tax=Panacibacter ginsenosidivorans TaxID=1813871 RepID=A0A5B8V9Y5_9BACT|nr:tetratricopeptide repeat protein [Panacibacter ginsenosidivorans]QEC67138.1 tetratricopeptide repeat protein [Panacibacter ginsenosidivorans]
MSELNRHQHIERARLLLSQRRYKDAETQAGIVLQQDPNDADALQIIGHCRLDNKQYDEALKIFQQCIGHQPDDDYVLYLIAFCYYRKHEIDAAQKYLEQAIAIFPYNAGYFSLLSNIHATERRYADALYAANQGLQINAEDIGCLNARSAALFRLNKKEEAYETINESLQVNPEDDYTHTNYGWHYLEKGKHKQAYEHFSEALRINPNNNAAKEGYKASLKSKLPFYRWILQYSLWMNHQNRTMRIVMIFGLWGVVRALTWAGKDAPVWWKYVTVGIVFIYLAFVMLSWLGNSLANLFLLTSKHGRLALTDSEKSSAKAVGIVLVAGILSIACGIWLDKKFLYMGLFIGSLSIPLSFIDFPIKWFKGEGRQVTAHIMILLCIITCIMLFINDQSAMFAGIIYFIFFVGYMWSGSITALRRR